MTPLFRTSRRAEQLHTLLEGGRPDAREAQTAELRALSELVGALRSTPQPQARPEFVADLREQLMVAARAELTPVPARHRDDLARLTIAPRRTHRERRIGLALGTVAVMGATTSMAVASQGALPGDALYPVKRAIENTQAGFSVGDDAKGETLLQNASGRLQEVGELTRDSEPDPALVAETLDAFSDQASEAGDLLLGDFADHGHQESIQQLQQFTHHSVDTLADLETTIPSPAHDALVNAAQVVFALDAAASNACPACGSPLTELPAELAGATTADDDEPEVLAGGPLPGAHPDEPSDAAPGKGRGGKDKPSGLSPPETPIAVPPLAPTATTTAVPDGQSLPTPGTGSGGGRGHGGKGGRHPTVHVDLGPVTDTVHDVLTGVVEGVGGAVGGLTGGQPAGGVTAGQ